MAKKATEATEKAVETADCAMTASSASSDHAQLDPARPLDGVVAESKEKPERVNASGFYIYIGPNLKKLIQTGTVYRGTRRNALKKAAEAIAAEPLVKTLIVSGDALPEARLKVKTPGNVLYANYQKLAGKEGK